jgi:hypothetical protein
MQLTLFTQINLIIIAVVGLVFCVFGYKYARFLLPVCGMVVVESLIYLLIGGYLRDSELSSALFYGGTAVASFIILFFLLRVPAFFTGAAGAAVMLYFVISAFGLSGVPYAFPVYIALVVIFGLIGFAYKRVGVIIATSLLGASLTSGFGLFVALAPGADYANGKAILAGLSSVIANNGYMFLGVFAVIMIVGLLIQLKVTGTSQILEERLKIVFESKK